MSADDFDIETAILAGDLLEQTWGEPVRVLRGEILKSGRFAKVYRLSFSQAPENALGTVVVKRILIPDDAGSRPEDQVGSRQRFQNEWAGLTLLSGIESTCALVPRLIAARQEAGIVVMDDVIGNATLDQLLLGADPDAAKQGLLDMCVTLGLGSGGVSFHVPRSADFAVAVYPRRVGIEGVPVPHPWFPWWDPFFIGGSVSWR